MNSLLKKNKTICFPPHYRLNSAIGVAGPRQGANRHYECNICTCESKAAAETATTTKPNKIAPMKKQKPVGLLLILNKLNRESTLSNTTSYNMKTFVRRTGNRKKFNERKQTWHEETNHRRSKRVSPMTRKKGRARRHDTKATFETHLRQPPACIPSWLHVGSFLGFPIQFSRSHHVDQQLPR